MRIAAVAGPHIHLAFVRLVTSVSFKDKMGGACEMHKTFGSKHLKGRGKLREKGLDGEEGR
jgi:hypothetical protein